ncbi:YlmC/YmxH family sporulation protein [Desulfohalotomaculum tongense]|uniref:YlmC/YmxH family sporulation protein n=1 Tax=Desulforadius tongensis TaxID=1216062 RepID=UPI00195B2BA2|nr:YlmC/YmxH family sporulation protein [Desulforadius tongensis]
MYKATELAKRDIINVTDGSKLGAVTDMHFDLNTGKVTAIVVSPSRKMGVFRAGREVVIPWERVVKFGVDAILVEIEAIPR